MAYVVIARKYRPQRFEEVIGQEAIAATLVNAIASDRVAQAYLFSGQRGVGKTSMARILAKALNCPEVQGGDGCNQCETCRSIMSGENTDVVEIDGASNNSVDNIRDLRDSVKYAPLVGRYKIYVIDEVHMLSESAFNALLKTLEEPPAHVKFIFATTEPHHVPDTIHSRCQRFDFRAVPTAKVRKLLEHVARAEKASVEARALDAVARRARGSVRDAESCLDQLLAYKPEKSTYEDYLTVFGLTAEEKLIAWLRQGVDGQVAEALATVAEMTDEGADATQLTVQMAELLREALLAANGAVVAIDGLAEVASRAGTDWILYALQVMQGALRDMRLGADGRLSLEMATARIASIGQMVSLDEIHRRLEALSASRGARPAVSPSAPPPPKTPISRGPAPRTPRDQAGGTGEVQDRWDDLAREVGKHSRRLETYFAAGRPVDTDGAKVVVGFPSTASMQFDGCMEEFDVLRQAVKRILGLDLEIVQLESPAPEQGAKSKAGAQPKKRSEEIARVAKVFNGTVIKEL